MKSLRLLRAHLALILAIVMAFFSFGCTAAEIAENIQLAGEIAELAGELFEDSSYEPTENLSEEQPAEDEPYYADTELIETKAPETKAPETKASETEAPETEAPIDRDGYYYSKDDVALYIHTYGELPHNFITKREAEALGWEGGSVERYRDGAAIGGDKFSNREGLLPKKSGRVYYECDIDTDGKSSRGPKRIVFSNDGLIYYTGDHYESFTLLYGED